MPPAALTLTFFPTWVFISFTSANVAPSVENPVDVLMYSAPAFVTISHILIFSSSVSRQVSMITFKIRPLHVSWIRRISSSISSYFPSFKCPILMTISISEAPFAMASFVSKTFAALVLYPFGNPMTVQIGSFPSTYSAAAFT